MFRTNRFVVLFFVLVLVMPLTSCGENGVGSKVKGFFSKITNRGAQGGSPQTARTGGGGGFGGGGGVVIEIVYEV